MKQTFLFFRPFIRITDYQAWRYIRSSTVLWDNLLYVIHRANSMMINITTKSISKLATVILKVLGGWPSLFSMLPSLLPYMCARNNNAAFPVKWDLKQILFWCKSNRSICDEIKMNKFRLNVLTNYHQKYYCSTYKRMGVNSFYIGYLW